MFTHSLLRSRDYYRRGTAQLYWYEVIIYSFSCRRQTRSQPKIELKFDSRFAQLQTKYGIAKILSEFELSVNPGMKVPVQIKKSSLVMEAEGGIWVDFKKLT